VRYQSKFEIMNLDVPYLVFGNCYYNSRDKKIFGQSSTQFESTDGERRVELKSFDNWFGNFPAVTGEKSKLALYYEKANYAIASF
jgi:hypothetical protein